MKSFASSRLWEAYFDKPLFRILLEEIVSNTSRDYFIEVLEYCYEKYSDTHADILFDVFSKYLESNTAELTEEKDLSDAVI